MGPAGPARRDERAGFCVADVRALKRRSRAEEARELLEKVAKQVQPLMRRRGWVCPSLVEFEPRSPNLLGLNVGGVGGVRDRSRSESGALPDPRMTSSPTRTSWGRCSTSWYTMSGGPTTPCSMLFWMRLRLNASGTLRLVSLARVKVSTRQRQGGSGGVARSLRTTWSAQS